MLESKGETSTFELESIMETKSIQLERATKMLKSIINLYNQFWLIQKWIKTYTKFECTNHI